MTFIIVVGVATLFLVFSNGKPMGHASNVGVWDTFENDVEGTYHKVSSYAANAYSESKGSDWINKTADVVSSVETTASKAATSAYDSVSESTTRAKDFAVSTYSTVREEVSDAATGTKDYIDKTYKKVETKITEAEEETSNFFASTWDKVASGFSSFWSGVGNFFSSCWTTVQTWWTELEEEVKEFIHFIL